MKSMNLIKAALLTIAVIVAMAVSAFAQTATPRYVGSYKNKAVGSTSNLPTQLLLHTFATGIDTLKFKPSAFITALDVPAATDSLCLVVTSFGNSANFDELHVQWVASGATRKIKLPTAQFITLTGLPYATATNGSGISLVFVYNKQLNKYIQQR